MALASSAQIDFAFRMVVDSKAGAAQHCLDRRLVGNEPVCRIGRVAFLDKEKLRIFRLIEDAPFGKVVIFPKVGNALVAALEALEQHHEATELLTLVSAIAEKLGVEIEMREELEELKEQVTPEEVLDEIEEKMRRRETEKPPPA